MRRNGHILHAPPMPVLHAGKRGRGACSMIHTVCCYSSWYLSCGRLLQPYQVTWEQTHVLSQESQQRPGPLQARKDKRNEHLHPNEHLPDEPMEAHQPSMPEACCRISVPSTPHTAPPPPFAAPKQNHAIQGTCKTAFLAPTAISDPQRQPSYSHVQHQPTTKTRDAAVLGNYILILHTPARSAMFMND